jgi:hypothetical protein
VIAGFCCCSQRCVTLRTRPIPNFLSCLCRLNSRLPCLNFSLQLLFHAGLMTAGFSCRNKCCVTVDLYTRNNVGQGLEPVRQRGDLPVPLSEAATQ